MVLTKTLTYEVRDLDGNIKLDSEISIKVREAETGSKYLIHKALVIQGAMMRQGTASCKTRSEVNGGGKKPWKQKGTGRARSGSSNSPLWKGGGVAFGPRPGISKKKLNNKEKQLALSTLISKLAHKFIVVDNTIAEVSSPNTGSFLNNLNKLTPINKDIKVLLVTHQITESIKLASRNIPNLQLLHSNTLNIRDLLLAKKILITKNALLDFNTL